MAVSSITLILSNTVLARHYDESATGPYRETVVALAELSLPAGVSTNAA